jgi:hypothetical protein
VAAATGKRNRSLKRRLVFSQFPPADRTPQPPLPAPLGNCQAVAEQAVAHRRHALHDRAGDGRRQESREKIAWQHRERLPRFGEMLTAEAGIAAPPRVLGAVFAPRAVLGQQLRRLSPDAPFVRMEDVADWRKIAALGWWKLRNA